jgi:hypothetical protein
MRLAAVTFALATVACGTATNYLDPSGPLYETHHAAAVREFVGPRPLRVITFNIEYAIHVDRAIAVLRETPALQNFDLLALQEMDAPGVEQIAAALGDPDVFLPTDIGVRNALRDIGVESEAKAASRFAESWRPWRAYALHHLWASLS